jgi:hypothetical protein
MNAQSERKVPVWIAREIEPIGIGEYRRIAIRGADTKSDEGSTLQWNARKFGIDGGDAVAELVRAFEPQEFLDCGADDRGILQQPFAFRPLLQERE